MRMGVLEMIQKHEQWIKYGLLVTNIVGMLLAIQAFIWYSNINTSIDIVREQISATQEHMAYTTNFLFPYLESSYAMYFAAHENNKIFRGEYMIVFEEEEIVIEPIAISQNNQNPVLQSPPQARIALRQETIRRYETN